MNPTLQYEFCRDPAARYGCDWCARNVIVVTTLRLVVSGRTDPADYRVCARCEEMLLRGKRPY